MNQFTEKLLLYREDTRVSHCRPPLWRIEIRGKVTIDAYVYSGDKNISFGGINSDGRGLLKNLCIKFIAKTNIKCPYETFWQVVNTGQEAAEKGQLRGGFDTGQNIHWESTEYKGRHWIECFIVKEGLCVARSGKFYVKII